MIATIVLVASLLVVATGVSTISPKHSSGPDETGLTTDRETADPPPTPGSAIDMPFFMADPPPSISPEASLDSTAGAELAANPPANPSESIDPEGVISPGPVGPFEESHGGTVPTEPDSTLGVPDDPAERTVLPDSPPGSPNGPESIPAVETAQTTVESTAEPPQPSTTPPTQNPDPPSSSTSTDSESPPTTEPTQPTTPVQIEPPLLGPRPGGNCKGSVVRDGRHMHVVDGRTVATTTVYYDPATGRNCALLTKARDVFYGEESYLALSLCNARGECDRDWYYYPREAGPVTIEAQGICLTITVSALTPGRTTWLLPETTLANVHCG